MLVCPGLPCAGAQVVAAAGRDISLIVERTVKTQMGVVLSAQLVPAFEAAVTNSVQVGPWPEHPRVMCPHTPGWFSNECTPHPV